jgi:deoxyribodipyrimidine photo-lyase
MAVSVMVFTRDLRVTDNPALSAAVGGSAAVLPLFVLDEVILARCAGQVNRLRFLLGSLADLDASLRARGGALVIRRGDWVTEVLTGARSAAASVIHVSDDVSGYATARFARLEREAAQFRVRVIRHPGLTVVAPGAIAPPGGRAYQVFTAYYRRWQRAVPGSVQAPGHEAAWSGSGPGRPSPVPLAVRLPPGTGPGRLPDLAEIAGHGKARAAAAVPAGGETHGRARLGRWVSAHLAGYDHGRDDLAADLTSHLSAYLHFGCLSPRALVSELRGRPGADAFTRQLAWRDFFCQLLAAWPAAAYEDYRDRGDRWRDDPDALAAWQAGQTGYPIVDAGMRQLAAEGFMHNRARMIVASFLAKDLYLDWRAGAEHFMRELADGDLAINQLNWQWVAGTGTDTSRYRIFSPVRQGTRFDPSGDYIRRYVPELAALPASVIHDPGQRTRRECGYLAPLVDHRESVAAYRARHRPQ